MPDEGLTPEQLDAVETLDADLLVSAGAGTGKTRVLTRRFSHIVERGRAAVDEILALTFTDKAAHEMKERIVDRFRDIGREDERRQVESAYISTIHSFCSRVLRENALEAGVDPHFIQLEEADAGIVQRQVYEALVRRVCDQDDVRAMRLLLESGVRDLRDIVFSLYRRMRSLGKAPQDLVIPAPPKLDQAAARAREALAQAAGLVARTKGLREVIEQVHQARPRLDALLETRKFDWECYGELQKTATLFGGNIGASDQKPILKAAKEALEGFAAALLAHHAAAQAEALREFLAGFDTAYSAAKDEQGQLDFDDLLVKARGLFGTPQQPTPTARRYRDHFKFFLMDEFQDTNRLQMSVVMPLLRPRTSFTVGDAKQSIYRFLYADVGVFLDREQRIADGGGRCKQLTRNFRSHPQLLNFTNGLFRDLWAEDGFPFGALTPGKEFGERQEPRIEALVVADSQNARDRREREAQLIARRISEMTGAAGASPMELTEDGKSRPVRFGDIMILFRATSDIQIYEDALAAEDIPYYTVSGRGFYSTQEVRDLTSLLAVVENPTHDVAMAAVLRSPLVGVGDEALYWLGAPEEYVERDEDDPEPQGAGRIAHRLERLDALVHLSPDDRERLWGFRALLHRLRRSASQRSIADLLEDAIRGSDYDLKILCQRNGRRRYANVEKLRQVALAFQEDSGFALRHFLDYLETLQTLAERETEAATEAEEADVARLMTIHAAKGLEAPVVIAADLHRQRKSDSDRAILSDAGELALRLSDPLADKPVNPPDYERLREEADAADRREDKRLFYVACTRAKEHLILSGCALGKQGTASSKSKAAGRPQAYGELGAWGQWVMKFLGISEPPEHARQVVMAEGFAAVIRSDAEGAPTRAPSAPAPLLTRFRARIEAGQPLDISVISTECDAGKLCGEAQAVADRINSAGAPLPAHPTVSVTGAVLYQMCPRRYRLALIELLPEDDRSYERGENPHLDRDEDFDPRERGTRLHDLLCQLDFSADFDQQLDRLTRHLAEDERTDARDVLERFRRSELWPQFAQAHERQGLLRETPFVIRLGEGALRGQVDALVRQGDVTTIVDYKSGSRRDGEYRDQLYLYALACRDLFGVAPARGIIYYLDAGQIESFVIDEAGLKEAAVRLEQVMRGLAAGDFPRREGAACVTCALHAACRAADARAS